MKTCTKCGIEKDESDFGKHKLGKNGLSPSCRACKLIESTKWRIENKARSNELQRIKYHKNVDKARNRVKTYYVENKEKRQLASKKWRDENPEKAKESNRKCHLKRVINNPEKIKKWASESYYRNIEKRKVSFKKYAIDNPDINKKAVIKYNLKKQIGETPPPELVEVKLLINKTKRLCKTLKSCETH